MKKLKKARVLLLTLILLAVSLTGCGKKNEPVADLNNWLNGIYIADTYTEEMGTTFTEEEFKEYKESMNDKTQEALDEVVIDSMKAEIAQLGSENEDQKIEDLMNELKDSIIVSTFESYKKIEYTVEEVSKDNEKASLKVTSAPINNQDTAEKVMTLLYEKMPTDIDLDSITPEKVVETYDQMMIQPMISAYQEGFGNPIYLEKQEVLIDMQYNKEAKRWEPTEESAKKLETIFLV